MFFSSPILLLFYKRIDNFKIFNIFKISNKITFIHFSGSSNNRTSSWHRLLLPVVYCYIYKTSTYFKSSDHSEY